MYLKLLLTTAAAATSLPAASAIYIEGAEPATGDGPMLMSITNTMKPDNGDETGGVSITTTNQPGPQLSQEPPVPQLSQEPPIPQLYQDPPDPVLIQEPPIPELYQEPIPELYQDSRVVGPTWVATKYYDAAMAKLVDVVEGSTITLEVEEGGRFDGHAGCNNYFGGFGPSSVTRSATNSEASVAVAGPVGSTMMMCEDALMVQETAYLANLDGTIPRTIDFSVSQDGKLLELKDAETEDVVAEYILFTPIILGQIWTATKYYSSEAGGLVDVTPGSLVTLSMEVNERLDGSAGCNTYIGGYDNLTSTSFDVAGPIGNTKMMCDEPDGVMKQEETYLLNFEDGSNMKWEILGDGSLELRNADSNAVIALYTAGLDVAADPLSTSGSMTIETAVAAFAIVTAMVFV